MPPRYTVRSWHRGVQYIARTDCREVAEHIAAVRLEGGHVGVRIEDREEEADRA